jgi:hypothetical protein
MATCVNNYCDGCFADFYDGYNRKVDCKKGQFKYTIAYKV